MIEPNGDYSHPLLIATVYETDMGNDSTPGHNPKNPDSHFPLATPSFTQNALRVYEALSALLPPIMVPGLYLHAARMQLLPAGKIKRTHPPAGSV